MFAVILKDLQEDCGSCGMQRRFRSISFIRLSNLLQLLFLRRGWPSPGGVYGSNNYIIRRNCWRDLEGIAGRNGFSWGGGGDFNAMLAQEEKQGVILMRQPV